MQKYDLNWWKLSKNKFHEDRLNLPQENRIGKASIYNVSKKCFVKLDKANIFDEAKLN